jgi:ADP-ribose pyrophosphatase YjhB (NUDIX family)/quercetin dioxygenase-like cupin family protein
MTEEILHRRDKTLIRRQRLAPGESTPWHRDPYHRVTVVLSGDALTIEYRDGSPGERLSVHPGQVDWDEPTDRVHRGVNVSREPYEEIAVFFLDHADAHPQPGVSEDEDHSLPLNSAPERTGAVAGHSAPTPLGAGGNNEQDIVGVSSVVRDGDGRILLIKTANAGWELPGGQVEQGEDLIGALVREVREETGCEIEVGRLTGITLNTGIPRVTILTFLCRHIAGEPYPGDDSIDAGWVAPDTAVGLVTHPVEQLRLKDALGDGQGVVYRAYRRIPSEGPWHETFEVQRLLRC